MTASTCPSEAELAGYLVGRLATRRSDEVEQHVDDCPRCQASMQTIDVSADTLLTALRQTPVPSPYEDEAACTELLAELERLGSVLSQAVRRSDGATNTEQEPLPAVRGYELLEKIGQGGMGAVYKARHESLKRLVAIKILASERMTDAHAVARFKEEMKAVGKLEHANIVRATDAGEADGTQYLVMEYVPGVDLSSLVRDRGPLPIADACEIASQAALALQYAHEQDLVHRDVKPSNLMLSQDGQVKLLDLGLARATEPLSDDRSELTAAGQLLGTPEYMAPEQAGDVRSVDARADVYSLGATLYKLLSGKAPLDSEKFPTPIAKLQALAREPIEPIRLRRADVPSPLVDLLNRMLAQKPAERISSMAEVAKALSPFCVGANLAALLVAPRAAPSDAGDSPSPIEKRSSSAKRLLGLIAVLAVVIGAVVVRVVTDRGTLVIDSSDPGLQVAVRQGSRSVRSLELQQGENILTVRSGQYEVVLTGKSADRWRIEDAAVTISRGDEAVVKIYRIENAEPPAEAASTAAAAEHPVDPAFIRRVATLPPEEQVKAVIARLQELNPGFDGQETHTVQNETVVDLRLIADELTDISPLRGLEGLQVLYCHGSGPGKSRLADLSPLKGLKLIHLACVHTEVAELSPLAGMPLTGLNCEDTHVSSLEPLSAAPLTLLSCSQTEVSELSPLRGKKLEVFACAATQVSDLSPLKGMPLQNIVCGGTKIKDLSPLAGMPLRAVSINGTDVSDLSPLQGMALTTLGLRETHVSDLSVLAGMPIETLHFIYTPIGDFSSLAGMPLKSLTWAVRYYHEPDTTLLKSLPLDEINGISAADFWREFAERHEAAEAFAEEAAKLPADEQIAAIAERLKRLNEGSVEITDHIIADGAVTELILTVTPGPNHDLAPLRALTHLRKLELRGANPYCDLSPLNSLPLEELTCGEPPLPHNAPVLQLFPSLKTLNGKPAAAAIDAPADSFETATLIKLDAHNGGGARGRIDPAEDHDFFKFVTTADGQIDVEVIPSPGLIVWIEFYAADRRPLDTHTSEAKPAARIDIPVGVNVRAGEMYYLRVESVDHATTGGYQVNVRNT